MSVVEAQDPRVAELLEAVRLRDELLLAKDAQLAIQEEMLRVYRQADADHRQASAAQQQTILSLTMPGGISPLTVRQIYEKFEPRYRGGKSYKSVVNRLRAFVVVFGDDPAMTVTPKRWVEFRERRKVADPVCGAPVAPLTINFELNWAKRMFNWATEPEQNLLPSNPLAKAKNEKVDDKRETWLTEKQMDQLLAKCDPIVYAYVLIAVDTGKRISEVMSLRRDRMRPVELTDGRRFAICDISKRSTKSKRADQAALTPRCLDALARMPKPPADNPFLFPSPVLKRKGKAISVRNMRRLFREACVASGVDVFVADGDFQLRPHDLRHQAATSAARRGATLPQVQALLNHASPAITSRYVHLGEQDILTVAQIQDLGAAEERRGPKRVAPTVTRRKLRAV